MSNDNTMLTVRSNVDETVPRFVIIPGHENYIINTNGEIFNKKTNKKISTYIGIDNYEHCVLRKNGKKYRYRVHSLMGKAFLGRPQVVSHIDNNKSNNKLSNLKASTHKENIQKAYDENVYTSTYKVEIIAINTKTNEMFDCRSMREAERITGVDRHRIKTFLQKTRKNYTDWKFYYNK